MIKLVVLEIYTHTHIYFKENKLIKQFVHLMILRLLFLNDHPSK